MNWTARAAAVASLAHRGQVDKLGQEYITHPARVVELVRATPTYIAATSRDKDMLTALAWVHDVVEDTQWSVPDVTAYVMSDETLQQQTEFADALTALTHPRWESRTEYYTRVRSNSWAVVVKRADIADNTDPARLESLDEDVATRLRAKYTHAVSMLNQVDTGPEQA